MAEDTENVAQQVLNADRRARAINLRVKGANWSEIARDCGYPSPAAALRDVGEAMAAATMRADETADTMRDTANLRLEHLLSEAMKMITEDAPPTYDAEGNEIGGDDRSVRLRAVDESRRLVESITKLNGVKPPESESGDDKLTIRIVGLDPSELV